MAEIKQTSQGKVVDYMARDYNSFLLAMREQIPEVLPEWTDYQHESDFSNVILQLFSQMGDIISYYQDRIAGESFLSTAKERRSIIEHLNLIGYRLATASPAVTALTLTAASDNNGVLTIRKGNAFATKSTQDNPPLRFEYGGDNFTIDFGSDPNIVINTDGSKSYDIQVEEGRWIEDDVLGVSNGQANQRFSLSQREIILRTFGSSGEKTDVTVNRDISLLVELGSERKEWTLQKSFAFSRADREDYTIEIDENDNATIVFGDGKFGAIPANNASISVSYRVGGGNKGNVLANTIKTIFDAPELNLAAIKVVNKSPATGGSDRETIDHAISHAPKVYRSLQRAVAAQDYEALALTNKSVGKVRAESASWNTVTLYIAPSGGGYLSHTLKADLRSFFEDKRPLSTSVEFDDVDYVEVFVSAAVDIESYYSNAEKKDEIISAVAELLAFENVDFKQLIYLSKFYEAIESIKGVKAAVITEFRRENPAHDGLNDKPLGKIELLVNEIPVVPVASEYSHGIKLELIGGY
ncbi:MAG: hypothetical protein GQ583_02345 [Methyloprofundus sp.]|nr:hypothetical protein [Methyloprofundus sp.]